MTAAQSQDFPCRDGEGDVCGECGVCVESYEPVRCARCEGFDLPQLPHALGCPNDSEEESDA